LWHFMTSKTIFWIHKPFIISALKTNPDIG
jgi:hypothetical protein